MWLWMIVDFSMLYPHISCTKADNLSPLPFLKVDEAQLYGIFQEVEGLKARGRMMVIILCVGWIKKVWVDKNVDFQGIRPGILS